MAPVFATRRSTAVRVYVDGCLYFHLVRTSRNFVIVFRTTFTTELRSTTTAAACCMLVLVALPTEAGDSSTRTYSSSNRLPAAGQSMHVRIT